MSDEETETLKVHAAEPQDEADDSVRYAVQYGVVWCGVVQCSVPKALLSKGNGRDVLLTGIAKWAGACACARSMCCVCYAPARRSGSSPRVADQAQSRSGDPLLLRLLVQLQLPQGPRHGAPGSWSGLDEALPCLGMREPHVLGLRHHPSDELRPDVMRSRKPQVGCA